MHETTLAREPTRIAGLELREVSVTLRPGACGGRGVEIEPVETHDAKGGEPPRAGAETA